jgi:rRNA maturation RNase YbeY
MIYLNTLVKLPDPARKKLKKYARLFVRQLGLRGKNLSVTICDNRLISKLNRIYLHKNTPTDVLSFPLADKDLQGDIFISLPKARENARIFQNTDEAELLYLLIHGLCHLSGYDHALPGQLARMKAAEKKLLAILQRDKIKVTGRI